jgi:hypothetical protein
MSMRVNFLTWLSARFTRYKCLRMLGLHVQITILNLCSDPKFRVDLLPKALTCLYIYMAPSPNGRTPSLFGLLGSLHIYSVESFRLRRRGKEGRPGSEGSRADHKDLERTNCNNINGYYGSGWIGIKL